MNEVNKVASHTPLKIFIGYDRRQTVAYTVLQYSLLKHAEQPISITPLNADTLPSINREALTPFAYTRFLVPWLCGFEGWAVFMDLDMLVTADIGGLFSYADGRYALMVVDTHHRFERASMMLLNCGHPANRALTPEYVNAAKGLHELAWIEDESLIGLVPNEWNFIVGTDQPTPATPKLIHYTQGVPAHPELRECDYARLWLDACSETTFTQDWQSIMGQSVWSVKLSSGEVVPRLHPDHARDQNNLAREIEGVTASSCTRARPSPGFKAMIETTADTNGPEAPARPLQLAHLENVAVLTARFKAESVLEYGSTVSRIPDREAVQLPSGQSITSVDGFLGVGRVARYSDLADGDELPGQAMDGVVSIDYLQRLDPMDLQWVLDEIFTLARRFVYLSIACYKLPGSQGEPRNVNVHIKPTPWWDMLLRRVKRNYPGVKYFVALTHARSENGKTTLVESHLTG